MLAIILIVIIIFFLAALVCIGLGLYKWIPLCAGISIIGLWLGVGTKKVMRDHETKE